MANRRPLVISSAGTPEEIPSTDVLIATYAQFSGSLYAAVMSVTTSIDFDDGTYAGTLGYATLTTFRAWTLPDASGTIALTSQLAGYQPLDTTLTNLAAANWATNSLAIGTGSDTVAQVTFAANTFPARASTGNLVAKAITDGSLTHLATGLGTMSTQAANNVTITGGSITGITDLAVADGGTGASTAAGARTNFGLPDGVYTPTLTGVSNVAATTAYECAYMQVGSRVFVFGRMDLDPTAVGTTEVGISLPVASNFDSAIRCGGTAADISGYGNSGGIQADVTNDRAHLVFFITTAVNQGVHFSFGYSVI